MNKKVLEQLNKELESLNEELKLIENTKEYCKKSYALGKISGLLIAKVIILEYGDILWK